MTEMREPTPQERLLDALDQLTKPTVNAEWRGDGEKREIFQRTDPPLLDWLRESIGSSLGGSSGGGKSARERIPLDIAALSLYERVDERIRAWMVELGATPGKDLTPAQMLRSWYVLWSAKTPSDGLLTRYALVLEGWEQDVKDVLDPPKRIEITAPCPICGNEFMNIGLKLVDGSDDPNDIERVRVLLAVERESIDKSFAMCRACERVWLGVGPMRQLRIAIDDAEAAKMEGLSA